MQNIPVSFQNAQSQQLSGSLSLPSGRARAFVLFAHCFTCGKDLPSAVRISDALTAAGLGVLRFDFTGLGRSEGDFAAAGFSGNVSDLVAAAEFLGRDYMAPAVLLGHSLGGTAALQAASEIPSAVAVATIGSPADPAHVLGLMGDDVAGMEQNGSAEISLGGRPFRISKAFIDDVRRHDLPQGIAGLRKALLFLHAPLDRVVAIDNASELFRAAKHPKSFVSLDGADHLLSGEADAAYAGRVIAAWASRYLPDVTEDAEADAPEGVVTAKTGKDGYRTEIKAGRHHLVADEPARVGGDDTGPSPYGLLAAALASCTSMTLRMYARHKGLDLDDVSVRVRHRKVHAEDCEDCTSAEGRVDEFLRDVSVSGDLSDEQRQRLLEIADRCPVHRTLEGEVRVRSRLD